MVSTSVIEITCILLYLGLVNTFSLFFAYLIIGAFRDILKHYRDIQEMKKQGISAPAPYPEDKD